MFDYQAWQIGLVCLAAFIIGFSKTGIPGTGILMVPMMAAVFGGRLSIGATLPLLIAADCFAVAFYRHHADWQHLKKLAPWVILGIIVGAITLFLLGRLHLKFDPLTPIIGGIVLVMLGLSLLRGKLGDRLVPTSREGVVATGALAGFTTMVSNAAGPIMQIYLVATGMAKKELMGTTAWYFFIFNLTKVPFLIAIDLDNPTEPLFTANTLWLDLAVLPILIVGALAGKALLPFIPQKAFNAIVLTLAAAGAIRLLFPA